MSEVRLITPITRQGAQKMQVAAYCRVSSNSADQLNSYALRSEPTKKLLVREMIGSWSISLPMRASPE